MQIAFMHGQSKRDIPLCDHTVDCRPIAADDGGANALFSQTLTQRRDRVRWFDGNDFGSALQESPLPSRRHSNMRLLFALPAWCARSLA